MSTPDWPGSTSPVTRIDDTGRVNLIDDARTACADSSAGIAGHGFFHAGADKRCFCAQQRHSLTLHVRSHQRAVGVIVFQERNERCRNRNQLLGAETSISVIVIARCHQEFARFTRRDQFFDEAAVRVQLSVGLRNGVLLLFHRGEIDHFVGHLAVDDLAVRGFDEAIFVDAG